MKTQPHRTNARTTLGAVLLTLALIFLGLGVNLNLRSQYGPGAILAQATPTPTPIPAAPKDAGPKVGYENFLAPGVLTPVKTTEAGQQVNSVEFLGRNAGEPSVGSNWATGVANFQSGLQTLFITFDDSCTVDALAANWANRAAPTSVAVDSDPIGFTDRGFTDAANQLHSRVFAGELTLLSPDTVKISHTDDDGFTWVPDQSGGIASAVDHETIGGGAYHAPVPAKPAGTYPYAVYYCSQDIATALCSRSDDGGSHYGPSIPMYSLADCGGLHGHVKVAPDGTVYVPNRDCESPSTSAVVVSEDNGITWAVRPVGNASVPTTGASDDPALGIDADGKVYFLGAVDGNKAVVATSADLGVTWDNIFDVGAEFGLKQIAFPAAVGGSAGRAAVAFYGSTAAGSIDDSNSSHFDGVWHLYVSHTFDGGLSWTTTDVTPNAPMQRSGLLRGGGANITRNLLDFFDITIDSEGRVLVGYVDGCEGGNCKQAIAGATGNAYTAAATIARQSSGRRLLAAKDPADALTHKEAPGMPSVTSRRVGQVVHLAWSEADTGNGTISRYQILRGTAPNTETLLTEVTGTPTGGTYDDLTATDTNATYYYKVLAVNEVGFSCPNNEIAAPYVGDTCLGMLIHKNEAAHREASAGALTPASLLIDYIAVGEPSDRPDVFMFKMKVNDLSSPPPNSRWRIMWNSPDAETYPGQPNPDPTGDPLLAQQFYVGMTTGPSGPPTFEYGTLADAGVPAVFVISETKQGDASAGSNYTSDGTITIYAPKSAFGPQSAPFVPGHGTPPAVGSLLGAVGGRTLTGDVPGSPESKLERSNAFVDHTFVKAQSDNSYPPATYTVTGAVTCNAETVNHPPVAVLSATPTSGEPPLQVTFDGTQSSDPDLSDTLTYTFHFGDGSADVSGGAPVVTHTYQSTGTFLATLVVKDSRGATSQNTAAQIIVVGTNPTPTPTPTATPSATATPSPTSSPSPSPSATPTPTASASPSPTPSATPVNVQLLNISGRVLVQSGDNVGIAGFIITGSGTKRVMARALGPSVKFNGTSVQGALQDPYLEVHDDKGSEPLVNDNWKSTQQAEIEQTGLAPSDDRESAVVKRLPAGNYTAIIRGADGGQGVGLVEIYDLSSTESGELGNLSVRAMVGTDDNVLIDGLILRGGDPKRVLFRALGPSLNDNGSALNGRLEDPALEVYDVNGNLLRANDNWRDAPNAGEIQDTGIAPPDDHESAVLMTFQPGNYTGVVRGVGQTTGIALAEVYKLPN